MNRPRDRFAGRDSLDAAAQFWGHALATQIIVHRLAYVLQRTIDNLWRLLE